MTDRFPKDRDDEYLSGVYEIADHLGAFGNSNDGSLPGRVRHVLGSVAL